MIGRGVLLDPDTGRPEDDDQMGLAGEAIDAIAAGQRPPGLDEITRLVCMRRNWPGSGSDGPPVIPTDRDVAVLERLPKHIRRSLKLASQERGLKTGRAHIAGFTQGWAGILDPTDVMVADQTAVVGTTEALLFPYHFTLLQGGFLALGTLFKITIAGKITTAGATPGNLTLTERYGTTTAGTSLAASAALALQVSQTNITFVVELYVVSRSKGSGTTGSLLVIGVFSAGTGTTVFTTGPQANIPASAPTPVGIDTTGSNALLTDVTLGSASDSMTAQLCAPLVMS